MQIEDITSRLSYDPLTGKFTWIKENKYHPDLLGTEAGSLNNQGYCLINIGGVKYKAHRLAFLFMEGVIPDSVDHINRVRHDNRWLNLRAADASLQASNQNIRKDNTSGVKGVNWNVRAQKYVARIQRHSKRIFIGSFDTLVEAKEARDKYV
mgnify:FL=1